MCVSYISDKEIRDLHMDRDSYLTHVILPGCSAGKFMRKSRPFLKTSKFQYIIVSFISVRFSLNFPRISECQSGRLKLSSQRNSKTLFYERSRK